jgi:hypothetical protein
VRCREQIKLSSDVATLVARNANETVVAPVWGLPESAFCRSVESGGRFCVGAFGRNMASVAVKICFIFHLVCKEIS